MLIHVLCLVMLMSSVMGFIQSPFVSLSRTGLQSQTERRTSSSYLHMQQVKETSFQIPLGDGFKSVECKFRPIFANSIFFVTDYSVPFDINIEKPPKGFPAPIVTKAGPGGEQPGDVLRALTCWSQGFSAAGATSDISMFAGKVIVFDYVAKRF